MEKCVECLCVDCRKQDKCKICLKCYDSSSEQDKKECPVGAFEEEN